jgi:tRNA1(Val) A37 N6-methylase TrmN6
MTELVIKKFLHTIDNQIKTYEKEKYRKKDTNRDLGIIYTPNQVVNYIVSNTFKIFFEKFNSSNELTNKNNNFETDLISIIKNQQSKEKFSRIIKKIRILDSSCGSGRFLISVAEKLYHIYGMFELSLSDFDLKKHIIQKNLFGIEIEHSAIIISKLRLIKWLLSSNINDLILQDINLKTLNTKNINKLIKELDLTFNLFNVDFLLEFNSYKFDLIVGNPPYVENKKIKDINYKKKIKERYKSAYRLFDLSILFIEKSLELLKNDGCLSFILPNKFLSADYGIKIRKLLLNESEIKEIINISSLAIFQNTATYPIILSLKKNKHRSEAKIEIKNYHTYEELVENDRTEAIKFNQNLIHKFPSKVIPISGDIEIITYLFNKFKIFSETFKDLKIIYRPFGFLKYKKHFNNISEERQSNHDLLLIGTGNIGKYHILFHKRIKIAGKNFHISYFNYKSKFEHIWSDLNSEKLIFREIAKDLTCYYDPGIFCNITGLYFIKITSLTTDQLFSLLTILNSDLLNSVFKTLFSTLHMAGGYLRFNGSFIKRLPIPRKLPQSLSQLGKILQLLSQLKYDLNSPEFDELKYSELEKFKTSYNKKINILLTFFNRLSNSLVNLLYLDEYYLKSNSDYFLIRKLLGLEFKSIKIPTRFLIPYFNINSYNNCSLDELDYILNDIYKFFNDLYEDKNLIKQINKIVK